MKKWGYWVSTTLVAAAMASGGVAELTGRPETLEGMRVLGYPAYFVTLIGVWKLLGACALVAPGLPRLKEWAYAGIVFNMTGAAFSHLAMDSARWHIGVTLSMAALALVSWALRPAHRAWAHHEPAYQRLPLAELVPTTWLWVSGDHHGSTNP